MRKKRITAALTAAMLVVMSGCSGSSSNSLTVPTIDRSAVTTAPATVIIHPPTTSTAVPTTMPTSPIGQVATTTVATTTATAVDSEDDTPDGMMPPGLDDAEPQAYGAVLTIGNSGFEMYRFNQSAADKYVRALNTAEKRLDESVNLYHLIVPTSTDVCVEASIRAEYGSDDQQTAIAYITDRQDASITAVDVFHTLSNAHQSGEYVYFRTDHQWTSWGAYRAYEQLCFAMNRASSPPDSFTLEEYPEFLGSFYRHTNAPAMARNPDIVQAFVPLSVSTMTVTTDDGSVVTMPIVADVSTAAETEKYTAFLGGDHPLSVIENPRKTDGSVCVLVKDSSGNAMAPFLAEDYQTVYVVDYRYFDEVSDVTFTELVTTVQAQDVVFVNSISSVRNASLVEMLSAMINA